MNRLPIIRHIRWLFYRWRLNVHAQKWGQAGIGLGIPNSSDEEYLLGIWRGEH
jgi:hypothetical protein